MSYYNYFGNQLDPSKFEMRAAKYDGDFLVLASTVLPNQSITLKGVEAYFAALRLMAVSTGSFRCRIYSSSWGHSYSGQAGGNDRIRGECLFGTAQRPGVPAVALIFPGTGEISIDLEDVSAADNHIHLVFDGVCLYPK